MIFLEKKQKSGKDVLSEYEDIVHQICNDLYQQKEMFPVTLLFIPGFLYEWGTEIPE